MTSHPPHRYHLYGSLVETPWELPCPEELTGGEADVVVERCAPSVLQAGRERLASLPPQAEWSESAIMEDGIVFLRAKGLFEFLVSADGRRIASLPLTSTYLEAFQVYLFGQALSFALLRRGIESLHATVIVANGRAAGFVGNSGFGKSTLAASFVAAGAQLLTDDMLVFRDDGGLPLAQPGLPRLKLFPSTAERFLPGQATGCPINRLTKKQVIRLTPDQWYSSETPLSALYILESPETATAVTERSLTAIAPGEALVELVRNAFNTRISDATRLSQQFRWATRLLNHVPVKRLSYPRDLASIGAVVDAVTEDLGASRMATIAAG